MPRRTAAREPAQDKPRAAPAQPDAASLPEGEGGGAKQGSHQPTPGPGLHLIATPIGAARDITLRALDILAGADVLAAEDTRSLRRLMDMHGIALRGRPLLAYHDHNGARMRPRLLSVLAEGRSVAYASEAGTPLVADPGYRLAREAIKAGHSVMAAPGASAVLAALTVAGLPSDRFCFLGFPPSQRSARLRFLQEAATVPATLVLYESPKRIQELLGDMVKEWGPTREGAICRELTKKHEEVIRGDLGYLHDTVSTREMRGEIVLVVDRAAGVQNDPEVLAAALTEAMADMSLREAADHVAKAHDAPRRQVYQMALALRDANENK